MPDDIVTARIVFDTGGIGGAVGTGGTGGSGSMGESVMNKSGMMKAVTIPLTDVLHDILSGLNKLARYSPMLNAELIHFGKAMQLLIMPIGDDIANWLRPMAAGWLDVAAAFYSEYKSGGIGKAIVAAFSQGMVSFGIVDENGKIQFEGVIKNIEDLLTISAVLVIGGAILKAGIGSILNLVVSGIPGVTMGGAAAAGAAGVASLLIPASISFLVGEIITRLAGGQGPESFFVGLASALTTVGLIAAGSSLGVALAIPASVLLTAVVSGIVFDKMANTLADQFHMNIESEVPGSSIAKSNKEATEGIAQGATTIQTKWDETTGSLQQYFDTAQTEGDKISANFESNPIFAPLRADMDATLTKFTSTIAGLEGPFDVEQEDSVPNTAKKGFSYMGEYAALFGTEIDKETMRVATLNTALNNLPNIDRNITYHIKYKEAK